MATAPAPDPKKLGNETRSSILPTSFGDEFLGPSYDFADELKIPSDVGVKKGNSLGSVVDAARGVAYYADMIGYGNPSSSFTRGMKTPPTPMGINYFVRTPTKCSNGADMWIYVNGIPKGDAFGKKIQKALQGMGVASLQGLAPGMIEDVKAGLDPRGVANAVFGSGYAECKKVELPVGDVAGKMKSSDGVEWIRPAYAGDIKKGPNGRPVQSRFVFSKWLTQEEFTKQYNLRTFCPDGSSIVNHEGKDCNKPLLKPEGFMGKVAAADGVEVALPAALLVSLAAFLYLRYRN